ncbi:MAG: AsmA family protein [candidate division KSB1 bacterium]|nr:AsmA family protein [candidate division KSB1 bacterium]
MKRLLKIILYTLGSGVVLIMLLGAFSQTALFKNMLRKQLIRQVNQSMNGELSLGRIEGNLFQSFTLVDIHITTDDTLLRCSELQIRFKLAPLLRQRISLQLVALRQPVVNLNQTADGRWNITDLLPESSGPQQSASRWSVIVDETDIRNGRLTINHNSIDSVWQASDIHVRASLAQTRRGTEVHLRHLGFHSPQPYPDVQSLNFRLRQTQDSLRVSDLDLKTPAGGIAGDVLLVSGQPLSFAARLIARVNVTELAFLNLRPPVPAFTPVIHLQASGRPDSARIHLNASYEEQTLQVNGFPSPDLSSDYRLDAAFEQPADR